MKVFLKLVICDNTAQLPEKPSETGVSFET